MQPAAWEGGLAQQVQMDLTFRAAPVLQAFGLPPVYTAPSQPDQVYSECGESHHFAMQSPSKCFQRTTEADLEGEDVTHRAGQKRLSCWKPTWTLAVEKSSLLQALPPQKEGKTLPGTVTS
ncbi:hypothetical protein TREES_T100006174 [Tupaia chinensis]|uniref:Uncharacterized protein n=1 Tax=Tupaia chinensis TaxID=246437 RepID=L9LB80_TUPCH|nr:hypothetical protein TREES_T100006174 [Tupaia chinensis]